MKIDPNPHPPLPLDLGPTPIVMLALIICGFGLAIGAVLGASHLLGRIGSVEQSLQTLTTFERCPAPAKPGDILTITVRHTGPVLLTRCQVTTDWRSPERTGP